MTLLSKLSIFTCLTALAATASFTVHATPQVERDVSAAQAAQVEQKRMLDLRNAPRSGNMPRALGEGFGGTNGPYANPYRTYPPSCMADPLPLTPSGPLYQKRVDMASWNQTLGGWVREPVTVTIWRVPCSSSSSSPWEHSAITLLRIQRDSAREGDDNQYVVFPAVQVSQGSTGFDDPYGDDLVRMAPEPNTIVSWTPIDSAMVDSTTYVLENYPVPERPYMDFTQAFDLRLDNFITDGTRQYFINVPAYQPSASTYPDAGQPLPINGYLSSNYYDPAHVGEDLVVQIYELGETGKYHLSFSWFTYAPDGTSFWILGDQSFDPGARTVSIDTVSYADNGGFAGSFGASATPHAWGNIDFRWDDCNHMTFNYQSQPGLPADVPQGSGSRTWVRVAPINGLTCE